MWKSSVLQIPVKKLLCMWKISYYLNVLDGQVHEKNLLTNLNVHQTIIKPYLWFAKSMETVNKLTFYTLEDLGGPRYQRCRLFAVKMELSCLPRISYSYTSIIFLVPYKGNSVSLSNTFLYPQFWLLMTLWSWRTSWPRYHITDAFLFTPLRKVCHLLPPTSALLV